MPVPSGDRQMAGAALISAMHTYAHHVLYPAQALKRAGVPVVGPSVGALPKPLRRRGMGPYFSRRYPEPVLLDRPTSHDHLVEEFDRGADVYGAFVEFFSRPIFEEALIEMRRYLPPDARVLDAGCGPGRELRRIAQLVPEGEIVGIDLAAGMVKTAHRASRAHGIDQCAFFQADVSRLPRAFAGKFDVVYSSLAHHHYPQPGEAAASVLRSLRPGGVYCIIDPGPAWYNAMSEPCARWADPGWIGFHTPQEFERLLLGAGFARMGWVELLPGWGLAVAQRSLESSSRS